MSALAAACAAASAPVAWFLWPFLIVSVLCVAVGVIYTAVMARKMMGTQDLFEANVKKQGVAMTRTCAPRKSKGRSW